MEWYWINYFRRNSRSSSVVIAATLISTCLVTSCATPSSINSDFIRKCCPWHTTWCYYCILGSNRVFWNADMLFSLVNTLSIIDPCNPSEFQITLAYHCWKKNLSPARLCALGNTLGMKPVWSGSQCGSIYKLGMLKLSPFSRRTDCLESGKSETQASYQCNYCNQWLRSESTIESFPPVGVV